MTDQIINLQAGQVTTLPVQLASGTTIQNQSTQYTVWVSGNANVADNNGTRLDPYGTLEWNGGSCYAYCDNNAPVSLSTTAQNMNNPFGVAYALQAAGVPNVLQGAAIPTPSVNQAFNVSGYASVSFSFDITAPSGGLITITSWADSLESFAINTEYVQAVYSWSHYTITVPVYGPYMSINAQGCTITLHAVYGSNRLVTDVNSTTSTDFHWDVVASTNYNAGFTYPGGVFATQGGIATWYLRAQGGSTWKGAFGYQYWDIQGANPPGQLATMQLISSPQMTADDGGNLSAVVQQVLPRGIFQPFFYTQTTGSYSNMRIIGIVS